MFTLQIFLNKLFGFTPLPPKPGNANHDPLRHPDIETMSQRELADLPLSPWPATAPQREMPRTRCA
ncbi:hypothetical protein [Rhizobium sp. BK251]|uniref:hypothetical protein n=1 Tax=Rhizobium sp. BK251 TaxID=2512125 RepID=UPI0010E67A06|nr:hypothetical protein [Rhizobium sp. BK251]TCL76022.1 hypothetical protein EV286_101569 [Rhizobium sp. BK251]